MTDWSFIVAPSDVKMRAEVNQAMTCIHSLLLVNIQDTFSGLGEWVYATARQLTDEEKRLNQLFGHYVNCITYISPDVSFPQWVDSVARDAATDVAQATIDWLKDYDGFTSFDALLETRETFVSFIDAVFEAKYSADDEKENAFDAAYWAWHYDLLQSPEQLKQELVSHLRNMWDRHLEAEWRRNERLLRELVATASELDFGSMNAFEATEAITGRNLRGKSKFEDSLEKAHTIYFVPTPHLGPYMGWLGDEDVALTILYGAHAPRDTKLAPSPVLNRSELLVRLNALADDTRLQIIELLVSQGEMCAQDFINELNLSQSSASRHLRQLTASGFLTERRKDIAKCYTLNYERVEDTITAIRTFLKAADSD